MKVQDISEDLVKICLKKRTGNTHKNDFGHVLAVAGSYRYSGAGAICANAAMRAGSGLVTLAVPSDTVNVMRNLLSEVILLDKDRFEDDYAKLIATADSIAVGSGLSWSKATLNTVDTILKNANCPVVLDADALNVISAADTALGSCVKVAEKTDNIKNNSQVGIPVIKSGKLFENCKNKTVITPHNGEFARLSGLTVQEIENNKIEVAYEFAKKNKTTVVLKGSRTVVTDGELIFKNDMNLPQMSTGGMGDALTGIIASFIGQNIDTLHSAVCGVYVHALTAKKSGNMNSILASDIISRLPYEIYTLTH